MNEEQARKRGCGWLHIIVACIAVLLLISVIIPTMGIAGKKAPQAATASSCKQIATALRIYAGDHDGRYPDTAMPGITTANQAFRELIRAGVLDDEHIFGAMLSPFKPDGDIGSAPDFLKAVGLGENHWAMTKGVSDTSPAQTPLLFENPAVASWPPKWNTAAASKAVRGRTWRGGKIIVGFADSSVQAVEMDSVVGPAVPPKPDATGKDIFTAVSPTGSILDIEP